MSSQTRSEIWAEVGSARFTNQRNYPPLRLFSMRRVTRHPHRRQVTRRIEIKQSGPGLRCLISKWARTTSGITHRQAFAAARKAAFVSARTVSTYRRDMLKLSGSAVVSRLSPGQASEIPTVSPPTRTPPSGGVWDKAGRLLSNQGGTAGSLDQRCAPTASIQRDRP